MPQSSPFLVPIARPQADVRLFCFPHAGGSAVFYSGWSSRLPASIELHAFQPPGRGLRSATSPFTDLPSQLDFLEKALLAQTDKRIALFGHSMGAMVAFELARRLEAAGVEVVALFISASRAPHLFQDRRYDGLADGPEELLVERIRRLGGTSEEVLSSREYLDMVLPPVRHDYRLIEGYAFAPGQPLHCPVTVLAGAGDAETPASALDAWRTVTTGVCRVRTFPGGHFYLLQEAEEVARTIAVTLAARRKIAEPDVLDAAARH